MLKKCFEILVSALIFKGGSLCALVYPAGDCCQNWAIAGEYLYWLPGVELNGFVLTSTTSIQDGPLVDNPFAFHSGFRLEGAYAFDWQTHAHLRYARLHTDTRKTVTGNHLWQKRGSNRGILNDFAGSATSDLNFKFQNVELLFNRQCWEKSYFSRFNVFAGLHYYNFSLNEEEAYVPFAAEGSFVARKGTNEGVGPELGLEFNIPLFSNCFSIVGQAYGCLLSTRITQEYNMNSVGAMVDVQAEKMRKIVSAWDARAGLQYGATIGYFGYQIELGYELMTYLRSWGALEIPVGAALFQEEFYDVNMQGLYLSFALTF